MSIAVALLVDIIAGLFQWIVRWILMFPITLITRYRKRKIMEGIEIRNAKFTVSGDIYPDINIHFWIDSKTTAKLRIRSLTLCLRSGQWEFARVHATPSIDGIPAVVNGRDNTPVNLRFDPPLKWWMEYRSNMNIGKAFLKATTSWGNLSWLAKITECSMDILGIDRVCDEYLSRIRLKREGDVIVEERNNGEV